MRAFAYHRASSLAEASREAADPATALLAGGTTLLDLAKCGVLEPERVVDLTRIPGLSAIEAGPDGASIGALARLAHVARHPAIAAGFPAVVEAILASASAPIRAMATVGGNLLQRTRCAYFRDPAAFPSCNKRTPGSGCPAVHGINRDHAVLGISAACIAAYPGDLATALVALDAEVQTTRRRLRVEDLYLLPGATPDRETVLEAGEIVTAVTVPTSAAARRSTYLKVRDRASYAFAAASAAVALELDTDGRTVRDIGVALGGVATRPWRARAVEAALRGAVLDEAAVRQASRLAVEGAVQNGGNGYKIDLVPRVVARAILAAADRV